MNAIFADTSYFIALLNPKDASHAAAIKEGRTYRGQVVTTEYVLLETANTFSRLASRRGFGIFLNDLRNAPDVCVISSSNQLFLDGMQLFIERADKEWSLTDCISFVVMKDRGLTMALTADHHFEQAGFEAILR